MGRRPCGVNATTRIGRADLRNERTTRIGRADLRDERTTRIGRADLRGERNPMLKPGGRASAASGGRVAVEEAGLSSRVPERGNA